jgi:hypothetical protein
MNVISNLRVFHGKKAAQQSVHLTWGILPIFRHFSGFGFFLLPHSPCPPTPVTQTSNFQLPSVLYPSKGEYSTKYDHQN